MNIELSKLKCGDKIRVLQDVKEPDLGDSIGGWCGEIEEVDQLNSGIWIYHIRLDKYTLSILTGDYITRCENMNYRYEYLCLKEQEIELIDRNRLNNQGVLIA